MHAVSCSGMLARQLDESKYHEQGTKKSRQDSKRVGVDSTVGSEILREFFRSTRNLRVLDALSALNRNK